VRKSDAFRRLTENGISARLAQRWIAEHGDGYVSEKLDFVEEERRRGRVRKTPAGYLAAAIKGDFRRDGEEEPAETMPAAAAAPSSEEIEAARREAMQAGEAAWRRACLDIIEANLEKRSPASRKAMKDRFERQLEDEIERGQFRRFGWQARIVFSRIHAFWSELIPEGLPPQP